MAALFETKNPAELIGNLTQFPPRGDVYDLPSVEDIEAKLGFKIERFEVLAQNAERKAGV
jgi:hypothetical protein